MPKRNREKLMEQSFYDLLVMMNKRAMPKTCILELIGSKRERCEIYTCEKSERGCINNCNEKYKCCDKCIADYLNEYPF